MCPNSWATNGRSQNDHPGNPMRTSRATTWRTACVRLGTARYTSTDEILSRRTSRSSASCATPSSKPTTRNAAPSSMSRCSSNNGRILPTTSLRKASHVTQSLTLVWLDDGLAAQFLDSTVADACGSRQLSVSASTRVLARLASSPSRSAIFAVDSIVRAG